MGYQLHMGLIFHRIFLQAPMARLILYQPLEPFTITILMIFSLLQLLEQPFLISKMVFCYIVPRMVILVLPIRLILICFL